MGGSERIKNTGSDDERYREWLSVLDNRAINWEKEQYDKIVEFSDKIVGENIGEENEVTDDMMKYFWQRYGNSNPEYRKQSVQNDIKRVEYKERRNGVVGPVPRAMEIVMRDWLNMGILGDGMGEDASVALFTHRYDDFFLGSDIMKSIRLNERGKELTGLEDGSLAMGFDVTIQNKGERLMQKLKPFENGLAYGFSRIKYYVEMDRGGKRADISDKKNSVPRFVIGMEPTVFQQMLANDCVERAKRRSFITQDKPDALIARFKILSEISEQAFVYMHKMPKDGGFEKEANQCMVIARVLRVPLEDCANKIMSKFDLVAELVGARDPFSLNSESRGYIREKMSKNGLEAAQFIKRRLMKDTSMRYDAVYANIMKIIGFLDEEPNMPVDGEKNG